MLKFKLASSDGHKKFKSQLMDELFFMKWCLNADQNAGLQLVGRTVDRRLKYGAAIMSKIVLKNGPS